MLLTQAHESAPHVLETPCWSACPSVWLCVKADLGHLGVVSRAQLCKTPLVYEHVHENTWYADGCMFTILHSIHMDGNSRCDYASQGAAMLYVLRIVFSLH